MPERLDPEPEGAGLPDLSALYAEFTQGCDAVVAEWRSSLVQWYVIDALFMPESPAISDLQIGSFPELLRFLASIRDEWRAWSRGPRFQLGRAFDESLLLFKMMQSFTYLKFRRQFPTLALMDAAFAEDVRGLVVARDARTQWLYENFRDRFGEPIRMVKTAHVVRSSFLALMLLVEANRSIEDTLRRSLSEPGEDELRDAFLEVFRQAEPETRGVSRTEYLYRCLSALDMAQLEAALLHDYRFVMLGLETVLRFVSGIPGRDTSEFAICAPMQ